MNYLILTLSLIGAIFLQTAMADWKALRGRDLAEANPYGFLRSNIAPYADWCITATNGVGDNAQLGFRKCDFDKAPANQLWKYGGKKFHSKLNFKRCMYVNNLAAGPRAKMKDCDAGGIKNIFNFDVNGMSQIVVQADPAYCLTNLGQTPESSDTIKAVKCEHKNDKFLFDFKPVDGPENGETGRFSFNNDDASGGCLVVKQEKPVNGQHLILGSCNKNHVWRVDKNGLFHTALKDNMCMQAGLKSATPKEGTNLRLYSCDKNNNRQKFEYNGVDIELRNSASLCVGFQGSTGEIGSDNLILKKCRKFGNNWST